MAYEAPSIRTVGSVSGTTLAQGTDGNDDQFLFFTWGTDHKVS
ncbi:hypothetical protein GCM10022288_22240 [Gryllotalpicola kribbensis]|jgi:hypothetical protein|uniref:Lasso RiPP family leader peptide-containing protein n=1 Tax=Gryllotalpicola kribbensis TaxID=993084 RepID=A0ABP8AVC1_9MICO